MPRALTCSQTIGKPPRRRWRLVVLSSALNVYAQFYAPTQRERPAYVSYLGCRHRLHAVLLAGNRGDRLTGCVQSPSLESPVHDCGLVCLGPVRPGAANFEVARASAYSASENTLERAPEDVNAVGHRLMGVEQVRQDHLYVVCDYALRTHLATITQQLG